jgi:hypothetical protein
MGLRLAKKATTDLEFGDDRITVRTGLSKGNFRKVLEALPDDFSSDTGFNPLEADSFTLGIFEALVVGWTLKDDEGNDVPATIENYIDLDRDSAAEVDLALFQHFNSLSVTDEQKSSGEKTRK